MPPAPPPAAPAVRLVLEDRVLHRIDPRLFGHFMERPSWGEIGIEAAVVPGSHDLQPGVLARLREMRIPILRFPGGTDVDYIDWRDMVDNVPGREGGRPVSTGHTGKTVTNAFGYDEFLRLCADLKAEPLIVVNFADGLLGRKPLREAALHAASLVAYCNAPAKDPAGWAAVRAKNGHPAPYGVRHVQIGNETWAFMAEVAKRERGNAARFYVECVAAYVEAIRAVDPSVKIVVDAIAPDVVRAYAERPGLRVDWIVQHEYVPWRIGTAQRGTAAVPPSALAAEEVWSAWVAIPGTFDAEGQSVLHGVAVDGARRLGGKAAVTEWNWNGRWANGVNPPLDSLWAKGVGAAGYVHALMRAGDVVEIACQSMTVGMAWDIACIHADPAGASEPFFRPTGRVTMFYARHHGDRRLAMRAEGIPAYEQPYRMGALPPAKKVTTIDALATADDGAIYVHAINRSFSRAFEAEIDVSAFGGLSGRATLHVLEGRLNNKPEPGEPVEVARVREVPLTFDGRVLRVTLPARTVCCVEIARR